MKPMPASATQRPTWAGVRSSLTPSEASTSAAPERDDSARLPCLATGTPAPATMKAAQVETLTDPEPSPPVPTISTASAGAFTGTPSFKQATDTPGMQSEGTVTFTNAGEILSGSTIELQFPLLTAGGTPLQAGWRFPGCNAGCPTVAFTSPSALVTGTLSFNTGLRKLTLTTGGGAASNRNV